MLKKILDLKVPALFDDHQQGTVKTEWQAYLFMIALFVVPVLVITIIMKDMKGSNYNE